MTDYQRMMQELTVANEEDFEKNLTPQSLFLSPAYIAYCQNRIRVLVAAVSDYLKTEFHYTLSDDTMRRIQNPKIQICNGQSKTDGKEIFLGVNEPRVTVFQAMSDMHAVIQGSLRHEEGHILFTDMQIFSFWCQGIKEGNLQYATDEQKKFPAWLEAVSRIKANRMYGLFLFQMSHDLFNILEDKYVNTEMCIIFNWNGETVRSLACDTLGALLSSGEPVWASQLPISQALLDYLYVRLILDVEVKNVPSELVPYTEEMMKIAYSSMIRDPIKRVQRYTDMWLFLLPFILEDLPTLPPPVPPKHSNGTKDGSSNSENQGNKEESNGGQPMNGKDTSGQSKESDSKSGSTSAESQPARMEMSKDGAYQAKSGNISSPHYKRSCDVDTQNRYGKQESVYRFLAENNSTGNDDIRDKLSLEPAEQKTSQKKHSQSDTDFFANDMKQLIKSMAEEKAAKQVEEQRLKDLQEAAKRSMNHYGMKNIRVNRDISVSPDSQQAYKIVERTVKKISRQMQREIINSVKQKRVGYKLSGLTFGRRFEQNALYRQDGKVFSKRKAPNDVPELLVSVLIDQSSSTTGIRDKELFATLIIEDMCRSLDIPLIVNGYLSHTGELVQINSYAEPNSVDNKEHLRLMGLYSSGGTPTGPALAYMLSRLEEYPAKLSKLLFILTDGQSTSGKSLLPELLEQARRDKILLIAAGVGDNRKEVNEEFPDNFLDISNVDTLAISLGNIIRTQLLR